jgi:glyoxylase-like metal-dependent hydrolase (beta-lactamase superfamily II)
VRPATPPPDFDLDLALSSLARMRSAGATRLLFSHFGPVTDVDSTLERSAEELKSWVAHISTLHSQGIDVDHAIAMVRDRDQEMRPEFYADSSLVQKFEELSSTEANVNGLYRWLDKQAED